MMNFVNKYFILFITFFLYFVFSKISFYLDYILALGIICYFNFKNDKLGSLFHIFLIFIFSDRLEPEFDFFDDIRVINLLLLTLFTLFDLTKSKLKFNTIFFSIVPFFLSGLISLAYSPIPFTSFQRTLSFLLLFFVISNYFSSVYKIQYQSFFQDITYFNIGIFFACIFFGLVSPDECAIGGRLNGVFGNANNLGLYCFILLPYYYFAYKCNFLENKIFKYSFIFSIILLLICLIWTNSRNALLCSIAFFYILFIQKHKYSFVRFTYYAVSIAFLYYLFVQGAIFQVVNALGLNNYLRLNSPESVQDLSGRLWSWNQALELIPQKLYFGGGMYFEAYIFPKLVPLELFGARGAYAVWNSYLVFLLNVGVVGTALYFLFIYFNYRKSKNKSFAIAFIFSSFISAINESWLTSSLNSQTIFFFCMFLFFQNVKPKFN